MADYALNHRDISILHIWLADNYNNICECSACRARSQTDWYVMLLNEIDERLTALGLDTRLAFLIYFELLWPPVTQHLKNPDRFILMFAPITRTYTCLLYTSGFGKLYENAGAVDIVLENQLPVLDTDGGLVGRGGIGVAQGIALKIVGKYRRAFCRGPKAGQRHGRQNRQRRAKGKNLLFHNESPFSNIPHPNRCDRPGI